MFGHLAAMPQKGVARQSGQSVMLYKSRINFKLLMLAIDFPNRRDRYSRIVSLDDTEAVNVSQKISGRS